MYFKLLITILNEKCTSVRFGLELLDFNVLGLGLGRFYRFFVRVPRFGAAWYIEEFCKVDGLFVAAGPYFVGVVENGFAGVVLACICKNKYVIIYSSNKFIFSDFVVLKINTNTEKNENSSQR